MSVVDWNARNVVFAMRTVVNDSFSSVLRLILEEEDLDAVEKLFYIERENTWFVVGAVGTVGHSRAADQAPDVGALCRVRVRR